MPPSTTSLFPDINVWIALTCEGHAHHSNAAAWFATLSEDATLAFCRFTQLGLLRSLTAEAVMSDEVMTQPQAWVAYDQWLRDPRVELVEEPAEIEIRFRALTRLRQPAAKDWADSRIRHGRAADVGHVRSWTARKGEVGDPAGVSGHGVRSAHAFGDQDVAFPPLGHAGERPPAIP